MKWSEFKKLVDAEVSRNSGLSIYNPFDPEIENIDVGLSMGITYETSVDVSVVDGKLNVMGILQ
jgi:hypothetical protein